MHANVINSYLIEFEYLIDEISNHQGQRHQEAHRPAGTGNQLCSEGFLYAKIRFTINNLFPTLLTFFIFSFLYLQIFLCQFPFNFSPHSNVFKFRIYFVLNLSCKFYYWGLGFFKILLFCIYLQILQE